VASDSELPWIGAKCAKCGGFVPIVECPPAPVGFDVKTIKTDGMGWLPGRCDNCGHAQNYGAKQLVARMVRRIVSRTDEPPAES